MARKPALTKAQVAIIRQSSRTLQELAVEFHVALMTVWKARNKQMPYNYEIEDAPVSQDSEVPNN